MRPSSWPQLAWSTNHNARVVPAIRYEVPGWARYIDHCGRRDNLEKTKHRPFTSINSNNDNDNNDNDEDDNDNYNNNNNNNNYNNNDDNDNNDNNEDNNEDNNYDDDNGDNNNKL